MARTPPPLPPTPLNYSGPLPPPGEPEPRRLMSKFLLGWGVGVALSVLVWVAGWHPVDDRWGLLGLFYFLLGFKVIGGVTAVCFRRWRMVGAGLLFSIAVGALIFGGAVFYALCGR